MGNTYTGIQFEGSQLGAAVVVGAASVADIVTTGLLEVLATVTSVDWVPAPAVLDIVVKAETAGVPELAAGWLQEPPSSRFWLEFEQEASS